jgi:hypothetical protein
MIPAEASHTAPDAEWTTHHTRARSLSVPRGWQRSVRFPGNGPLMCGSLEPSRRGTRTSMKRRRHAPEQLICRRRERERLR